MKNFVFLLLACFIECFSSGSNTLGPPTYQYMCTYAIEDYEGYEATQPRAFAHSNNFAYQFKLRMNQYQPAVSVVHYDSARNRVANLQQLTANSDVCELVQFTGHGYPNDIIIWPALTAPPNGTYYVAPGDRSYGGWTRWALFDACQVLKRGNSGLTDNSSNGYKYWFGGAHAVISHRANTYWFYESDCGLFGCNRYRSEYFYDSFAVYYAPGNYSIWDSWQYSYRDRIYSRGYGGSPAIVYQTFNIGGGTIVAGKNEYSNLQYNGSFYALNYSGAPTSDLYRTYVDYGTPSYAPLSPPSD